MMSEQMIQFQALAQRTILEILQSKAEAGDVYQLLCSKGSSFSVCVPEKFRGEWVLFRLALGCLAWDNAYFENHVSDERIQKIFLRHVLKHFETPSSLALASSFSEYLYSEDGTYLNRETVPIIEKFLKRLAIQNSFSKEQTKKIFSSAYIKTLVEIAESIRMSFQNEFLTVYPI